MCHGYFGRMQKEAECVTKIEKIIVGGIFIRLERWVPNGEIRAVRQVPNFRRSER
jgi:hypothetical protein